MTQRLLIIDATGHTLPMPNTILSSLEIGITAASTPRTVVDIDGVSVSVR